MLRVRPECKRARLPRTMPSRARRVQTGGAWRSSLFTKASAWPPSRRDQADHILLQHGAGQLATHSGAGIEPDPVFGSRHRGARRMAVHHDDPKRLLGPEEGLANSDQVVESLL